MAQCTKCRNYLFFKPLPDEAFGCCWAHGETVTDIDLNTGMSPIIACFRNTEEECPYWAEGRSMCEPDSDNPFRLPAVRIDGERYLKKVLELEEAFSRR